MKNLLDDPDVLALYKSLQSNKYTDIDDYLTSDPTESIYDYSFNQKKQKMPEPKIFFDGVEVQDFIGDIDYGL